MAKIRIYYPSDKIERVEINKLADDFRALDEMEEVYPIGRRTHDWTEFVVVLAFVSGFVAEKFFEELIKEAAKTTWSTICDRLKHLKVKLEGIPIVIRVEIEEDRTEVSLTLGTRSIDHLRAVFDALPGLFAELLRKMKERPSEVRSVRAELEADSGKFERAVGYGGERKRPTHVYDFEQRKWIPVSH